MCFAQMSLDFSGEDTASLVGTDCPIGGFRLAVLRVETADLVIDRDICRSIEFT